MDAGSYMNADQVSCRADQWAMLSLPKNLLLSEQLSMIESMQKKLSFLPCVIER